MRYIEELFEKFDLLLPERFDGGYLVVALYLRIKSKELDPHFTNSDIKNILTQLAEKYGGPQAQSERIVKRLFHFYLKDVAGEPGKYYLTDFAEELVELLLRKLENPYKNHPLRQSFSRYFYIEAVNANNIYYLQEKFGREFVNPHKRIINNHLETLDDELRGAITELNAILHSPEESATVIVKKFVNVFKKFGDRAEDITNAIATKDQFLYSLRMAVDSFYAAMVNYKPIMDDGESQSLDRLKEEWTSAKAIDEDLQDFFQEVDMKIDRMRKQIIIASEKLSELQEQFSSRSSFRMKIKGMFDLALGSAAIMDKEVRFVNDFPRKTIVCEDTQLFYPGAYDFMLPQYNMVIEIPEDKEYGERERKEIERNIRRQQLINEWVTKGKSRLEHERLVQAGQLIEEIMAQEEDLAVAHQVVIELTQFVSENDDYSLAVDRVAEKLKNTNLTIWKMQFLKNQAMISS